MNCKETNTENESKQKTKKTKKKKEKKDKQEVGTKKQDKHDDMIILDFRPLTSLSAFSWVDRDEASATALFAREAREEEDEDEEEGKCEF